MKQSYEELQTQVQALTIQRDGLIDELNKTQDEALDARAQRDALAAQVEVVRHAWESVKATDYNRILDEALELTPSACLAQVRAEAGRAGYQLGAKQWCFHQDEMQIDIERTANEYAAKILSGEVRL